MTVNFLRQKKSTSTRNIRAFIDLYAKKDNWHNIDKGTGNLGYGWVHYSLIRNLKPKRVLVIGSRYGFIPAVCALACRDNGKGIVDFVDAGYDKDNPRDNKLIGGGRDVHWGGSGFWVKNNPKKHFAKFGLSDYLKIYIMTSQGFKKSFPKKRWGYIYLDGDHSYRGVKADFERFWPSVTKGGILSLHDIYTKHLGDLDYGVFKYWEELKKKYTNTMEFTGQCGLGLLQK